LYQPSPEGSRKNISASLLATITVLMPVAVILAFTVYAVAIAGAKAGVPLWMQLLAAIVYVAIGGVSVRAAVWARGNSKLLHQWAEQRLKAQGERRASGRNAL